MRNWRDGEDQAVEVLSRALRTPQGSQKLRPIQAVALKEAYECRGLYLNARVGAGKTLVSGLLPTVMRPLGYKRALILVPGNLLKKTEHEFAVARRDWKVEEFYRLESYTALALEKNADLLKEWRPDMIICDEANKLRRLKDSAAPKRIERWLNEAPQTAFFAMSGTFLKNRITDYSHLLNWALRERSPLPLCAEEIENWSSAIDDADSTGLTSFCKYVGQVESYDHAKALYCQRLRGALGCIISDDQYEGSSLTIRGIYADPGLDAEFQQLRELYQRPDGWDLVDRDASENPEFAAAGSVWNVARQLALGFYYTCDPHPPREWMAARRAWCAFVREVIKTGALDTEKQVANACAGGARPPEEYVRWQALKDTFKPNPKPVWLNTTALEYAEAWGRQGAGVIWVDHTAFGRRLSERTGWSYYGEGGLDASGRMIEQAPEGSVVIASRPANQYGRNLQYKWCRGLVMATPNANLEAEQMLGRMHRDGQPSPWVSYDFYLACSEHVAALQNLSRDAQHAFDTTRIHQKVLDATHETIGERPRGRIAFR
jgi:hypothetical protein